jgi:hypothetical protein
MLGTRPFPNVIGSRRSGGAPSTLYFHETEDTDWDFGGNWFADAAGLIPWNAVPTAAQHAIIQNGTCDADGNCASLVVASTGTLSFNQGTVTNNDGTVDTNNGTVTTNNGTVDTNNGTITDHNSGATVTTNYGTIVNANNGSIVTTNNGTITNDNR